MILNAAAILETKDITPETTYTDLIHVKMIASSDKNGEICLFGDCKATINLYRIFSSMPEDLINAKCSEAYDKMMKWIGKMAKKSSNSRYFQHRDPYNHQAMIDYEVWNQGVKNEIKIRMKQK
jgi:hypothetical protein